ncbi:MAG: mannonate dehydratase [Clostridia bacterium]|nr:mannonate dehydratase [Clostridia bacterium]
MKLSFRWYGPHDPVTLEQIAQIPGMRSVVSAVYDTPVGGVWPRESIKALSDAAAAHGLVFDVVESVPVHEEIKLGSPEAPALIDAYCENLRRLGEAGVKCVCYNFMPVFDWLRSDLARKAPDGSNSLAYDEATVLLMNPAEGGLSLPGWDESYTLDGLRALLARYEAIGETQLWRNLHTFLEAVIPAAAGAGIKMAIHPDDPPWGIFGLPRIITNQENLDKFLKLVDMPENGLTFCTGSLGADPANDLPAMIRRYEGRIHFAHLRNIKLTGDRCFHEVGHLSSCGSLDMAAIIRALKETGFDGYIRPDHGRMIWGEQGKPGYGLFDRALGAAYINGLWEATR